MAMVPVLQFTNWQWLSLTLAAPVVVWGAWPFHRAAWANLRHGTATMDTLISVGTLAALGWSVYALFWGSAGTPGMTHSFELTIARTDGTGNIYLEAAAGVTTFILAGRYFEARAKRRAGAALRALLEMGAKEVSVRRGGVEQRIPIEQLGIGDEFVVRPGEKIAADGVVIEGSVSHRRLDAHRRVGAGGGAAGRPGGRCDGERRRPTGGAGQPRWRRHPAGPDGADGRGGAERQGAGAAAGRPDLGGVRPDRDRVVGGHLGLLDRRGRTRPRPRSRRRSRC